ncbi:MAG: DUF4911 domain-containing protein [Candidatus Muirbacterium halophilum]|nr:DUF4911 domain-containing protein [Candidatus Muirbacterium halophilum]MCK9474575.1 DUF4911 domain-containing protein [Candidatus Muirbacterium halophilum]
MHHNNTISLWYRIPKKNLYFVVNTLEAYEGLAIVRTDRKDNELNEIQTTYCQLEVLKDIMDDFQKKGIVIEVI